MVTNSSNRSTSNNNFSMNKMLADIQALEAMKNQAAQQWLDTTFIDTQITNLKNDFFDYVKNQPEKIFDEYVLHDTNTKKQVDTLQQERDQLLLKQKDIPSNLYESAEYDQLQNRVIESSLLWTPQEIGRYFSSKMRNRVIDSKFKRWDYQKVLKKVFFGKRRFWYFRRLDEENIRWLWSQFHNKQLRYAQTNMPIHLQAIYERERDIVAVSYNEFVKRQQKFGKMTNEKFIDIEDNPYRNQTKYVRIDKSAYRN